MAISLVEGVDVSRETFDRLKIYQTLLEKWNPAINLVAKSTLAGAWERHFLDSAQVFSHAESDVDRWLDIGSGGGFPGLVCAILAEDSGYKTKFTFIESDQRKCTFLRSVARELSLDVSVISERIEGVEPMGADVLTARALAPLTALLGFSEIHLQKGGTAIFLKGKSFREELKEALESWRFTHEEYPSATSTESVILKIGDIQRV